VYMCVCEQVCMHARAVCDRSFIPYKAYFIEVQQFRLKISRRAEKGTKYVIT
jgi:hypothetical protein